MGYKKDDMISAYIRKYLHFICKFDDVIKNIHINDLCEYNSDNWEYFVDDLMGRLDFYKLNK